ncbi:putative steryl acetyl hydrolase mug81 [Tilletia horrida]|nr:putative steryl acetyl hydrolase mug81 [Tilletia horrida]
MSVRHTIEEPVSSRSAETRESTPSPYGVSTQRCAERSSSTSAFQPAHPHMFSSAADSGRGNIISTGGSQFALPIGTTCERHTLYDGVKIPPFRPGLSSNGGVVHFDPRAGLFHWSSTVS